MKQVTSQALSLQTEISSRRKKMSDFEAQLPQLEEAKKAAVAGSERWRVVCASLAGSHYYM